MGFRHVTKPAWGLVNGPNLYLATFVCMCHVPVLDQLVCASSNVRLYAVVQGRTTLLCGMRLSLSVKMEVH